jgi:hypothetical protein
MRIATVRVGFLGPVLRCVGIPGIAVERVLMRPGGVRVVFVVLSRIPPAVLLEELLQEFHRAPLWKRGNATGRSYGLELQ